MKACIKGMLAILALSLSCASFACKGACDSMDGVNQVGGKTVGWLGDTGGKVATGTANLYGSVVGTAFQTTDKLLNPGCSKCDK